MAKLNSCHALTRLSGPRSGGAPGARDGSLSPPLAGHDRGPGSRFLLPSRGPMGAASRQPEATSPQELLDMTEQVTSYSPPNLKSVEETMRLRADPGCPRRDEESTAMSDSRAAAAVAAAAAEPPPWRVRAASVGSVEDVWRHARARRRLDRHPRRRDPRADGPERLGQVDVDQGAGRLPPARRRRGAELDGVPVLHRARGARAACASSTRTSASCSSSARRTTSPSTAASPRGSAVGSCGASRRR